MGLTFRSTNSANTGSTSVKNQPLTYAEGDGNFAWLATNLSGSQVAISGSTAILGNTTITGSFSLTGSFKLPNLTTANQSAIVTVNTGTGELYYTASNAFGFGAANAAGVDKAIQFNSASLLSGSAKLTYDYATSILYASGSTVVVQVQPNGTTDYIYLGNPGTFALTEGGLYSGNNDQTIAAADINSDTYLYSNTYYKFKNAISRHEFTGSLLATQGITGSLFGTSSWALNAITASHAVSSLSSSFSTTASYAANAVISISPISVTGSSLYTSATNLAASTPLWASQVIALGGGAGPANSLAANSVYIGYRAGNVATETYNSVMLGAYAGQASLYSNASVMVGYSAGNGAGAANSSVLIGLNTGTSAISASEAVMIGHSAGVIAASASQTVFIGYTAGNEAIGSNNSVFLGYGAGNTAGSVSHSVFIGSLAGYVAINNTSSIYIGANAGANSDGASYSILIGSNAGNNGVASSIGAYNTIIGHNLTADIDKSNLTNLGAVVFITGSYTGSAVFSGSLQTGKVGIGTNQPTHTLHISGSTKITSLLNLVPLGTLPAGSAGDIAVDRKSVV